MRILMAFSTLAFIFILSYVLQEACFAEKAKPSVGVYYFPGWYRGFDKDRSSTDEPGEWREAVMKAAVPRPVCGFYNDADPNLWNYYIPWMTTHGIDFIAFDWYYNTGQEYLNKSLDRGFLQAEKVNSIKFCVHWCNHGGRWWEKPLDQSKPAILVMTDLLCDKYFCKPNYMRINGCPVFMIYELNTLLSFGGVDGVKNSLSAMRERVKEKGFPGLFIVSVYSGNSPDTIAMLKNLGFDAFCAYTYCWMRPPGINWDTKAVPYPPLVKMLSEDLYPYLHRMGQRYGIPYWPSTFPGWDDRPRAGLENAYVLIEDSPVEFGKLFRAALNNINPSSPVVMVEAWNEWGEGACIEPSKQHNFGYLKAISKVLGKTEHDERIPGASEISSWSVLSPEELKIAHENESKPWPIKNVTPYRLGASYTVPRIKMPFVIDLTSNGVQEEELELSQVVVKERTAEGTYFETTGDDPAVVLPKVKVPAEQIKRIAIEGSIVDGKANALGQYPLELFWQTGLFPQFSQYASVIISWRTSGTSYVMTDDTLSWKRTGTPFLRLRIDPCSDRGVRFFLKRVILSED